MVKKKCAAGQGPGQAFAVGNWREQSKVVSGPLLPPTSLFPNAAEAPLLHSVCCASSTAQARPKCRRGLRTSCLFDGVIVTN